MTDPATDLGRDQHPATPAPAEAEMALNDLRHRADSAQQLAHLGDYDWHIESDVNTWSDELYRIFGYEPQSRNVDYNTYLDHCHADDRDRVAAVHRQSFDSREPYRIAHRIVRAGGEVRHLLCNGEVMVDESGTAVRLRGTSVDITDRVLADEARERQAAIEYEERTRRRAALEINDNVVQGLTASLYALEIGDSDAVNGYLRRTLDAAQRLITKLTTPLDGGDLADGELDRTSPSSLAELTRLADPASKP